MEAEVASEIPMDQEDIGGAEKKATPHLNMEIEELRELGKEIETNKILENIIESPECNDSVENAVKCLETNDASTEMECGESQEESAKNRSEDLQEKSENIDVPPSVVLEKPCEDSVENMEVVKDVEETEKPPSEVIVANPMEKEDKAINEETNVLISENAVAEKSADNAEDVEIRNADDEEQTISSNTGNLLETTSDEKLDETIATNSSASTCDFFDAENDSVSKISSSLSQEDTLEDKEVENLTKRAAIAEETDQENESEKEEIEKEKEGAEIRVSEKEDAVSKESEKEDVPSKESGKEDAISKESEKEDTASKKVDAASTASETEDAASKESEKEDAVSKESEAEDPDSKESEKEDTEMTEIEKEDDSNKENGSLELGIASSPDKIDNGNHSASANEDHDAEDISMEQIDCDKSIANADVDGQEVDDDDISVLNDVDPIGISQDPEVSEKEDGADFDNSMNKDPDEKEIEDIDSGKGADEELCIIPDTERVISQAEKDAATAKREAERDSMLNNLKSSKDATASTDSADKPMETDKAASKGSVENEAAPVIEAVAAKDKAADSSPGTYVITDCSEGVRTCGQCYLVRTAKYQTSLGDKSSYICDDNCLKAFKTEHPNWTLTTSSSKENNEVRIKCLTGGQLSDNMISKVSFVRKCQECTTEVSPEDNSLSWETMDFCNEDCLCE